MTQHIGRSWPPSTFIEDECPCTQEPCGLIDRAKASPDCDQHFVGNGFYARTMRQGHSPERCPGARSIGVRQRPAARPIGESQRASR